MNQQNMQGMIYNGAFGYSGPMTPQTFNPYQNNMIPFGNYNQPMIQSQQQYQYYNNPYGMQQPQNNGLVFQPIGGYQQQSPYSAYVQQQQSNYYNPYGNAFKQTPYGINQNYQEAYDLLKDIIINDKKEITDNLVCLYAELSIALNLDLNEVYNFLEQTINRRYSCSRYFTLIKLGKLINKDTKKYEKLYKKSIKYASEKEREYYLNNPNEFMINNN